VNRLFPGEDPGFSQGERLMGAGRRFAHNQFMGSVHSLNASPGCDRMETSMNALAASKARNSAQRGDPAAIDLGPRRSGSPYLTFSALGATFAMSVVSTKDIVACDAVSREPWMPDVVRGAIRYHGAMVPVVDLMPRLGFPSSRSGHHACIVIVEMQHEGEAFDIGVVVERVKDICSVPVGDLVQAPGVGANLHCDFVDAMARLNKHFVMVVHMEQVLSNEELAALAPLCEARWDAQPH